MTEIVLAGSIRLPVWVQDLESFRRWCLSEEYPDEGDISFLNGLLWVDPSMERDIHNQIKTAVTAVLYSLVMASRLGRFYGDRMRLVHPEAGLSTEPDASYVRRDSLQRQRVQLEKGGDSLELVGSPDMVLEVVSPTSVEKDTLLLMDLYYRAGVREYWLINPLGEAVDFRIYRHSARKFVSVKPQDGWLRSGLFGQAFRLMEEVDEQGLTEFNLVAR